MPLPPEALTITGGCNCRNAVCKISIPPLSERPLHPNYDPASGFFPLRRPFIFTDHCNDCRRATGSILPAWISGPLDCVSVSLGPTPEGNMKEDDSIDWLPAHKVFTGKESEITRGNLSFCNSSPQRYSSFCTFCGTNLTYWEEQLPTKLDILLGTVDVEYLSTNNLRPERHLWWDLGLFWVKDYVEKGESENVVASRCSEECAISKAWGRETNVLAD